MKDNILVIRSMNDYVDSDITDNHFKNSVVVYCRVSTIGQIKGTSLDSQQNKGIEFFEKSNIKFKNILVFRDEGKSGDDYDNSNVDSIVIRDLLNVIISKIEQNLVKHFWVIDSDRLSRSTELSSIIYKTFGDNDCNYYILNERKDVNSLSGGLVLKILTVFDEYENHKRFQKSTLGKIEHLKKNKWYGGNYPYGFIKGKGKGEILIDKSKSKYVKKIFELFNEGCSIKELIKYLNKEKVLPPKSIKKVWNEGTLRNILRSELYIGKNTVTQKLLKNRSREYCIEKNKVVTINQTFPKIIKNQKLFDEVQIKMNNLVKNSNADRRIKNNYLLKGLVFCGNCGSSMKINVNKNKDWKVYCCSYIEKKWKDISDSIPKCGKSFSKQIHIGVVEDLVWNEVLDTFKNSYIIKERFKNETLPNKLKNREQPLNQIKTYNKSISNYFEKIEKLNNSKIELFREKLTLKLSISEYESLESSVDEEIEFCQNKIIEKEKEIEITNNGIIWYDWLEDFDNQYNTIKSYKTFEEKREFIHKFVDKINVYWDNISNTHKLVVTFKLKIVKDKRINKEKYMFKVVNGQNESVIDDINSTKHNKLLKQKSNLKVGYQITQQ